VPNSSLTGFVANCSRCRRTRSSIPAMGPSRRPATAIEPFVGERRYERGVTVADGRLGTTGPGQRHVGTATLLRAAGNSPASAGLSTRFARRSQSLPRRPGLGCPVLDLLHGGEILAQVGHVDAEDRNPSDRSQTGVGQRRGRDGNLGDQRLLGCLAPRWCMAERQLRRWLMAPVRGPRSALPATSSVLGPRGSGIEHALQQRNKGPAIQPGNGSSGIFSDCGPG
jgi:hypothetical protein